MKRKRKGKDPEEVSFWQSYSDMMAALLLVFVLIIAVANYSNTVTNNKLKKQIDQYIEATEENDNLSQQVEEDAKSLAQQQEQLEEQQAKLEEQQAALKEQQEELEAQKATVKKQQEQLEEQETELSEQEATVTEQKAQLADQEKTMKAQQETLDQQAKTLKDQQEQLDEQAQTVKSQQEQLAEQQKTMADQQESLNDIIGVRAELIETLKKDFEGNDFDVSVDPETGAISLASNILFDYAKTDLKDSGKEFLNEFLPKYFDIILSDEFSQYISEVIIEGHTDQTGSYLVNLQLSQERAYAVAAYCLGEDSDMFDSGELTEIRKLVTANGRSSNDLIYTDDSKTTIDEDASRRVEIKFRLTEEEMIEEMSNILESE